jgi:Holliday junction DNA helicase RuvA subunit
MIDSIRGRVVRKSPAQVVVDVGGIALAVWIPLSSYEHIGEAGDQTILLTHLHVREDAIQLFGFCRADERDLFTRLIAVSGVGPKLALGILSRFAPEELSAVISGGDARRLTAVRGIGRKTAERPFFFNMTPSMPIFIWSVDVMGLGTVSAEISIVMLLHSCFVTGLKRQSLTAAFMALAITDLYKG